MTQEVQPLLGLLADGVNIGGPFQVQGYATFLKPKDSTTDSVVEYGEGWQRIERCRHRSWGFFQASG